MKVSVVILNWNGKTLMQEYLPNVVEHTLGKGLHHVELVVADNGSTDGSLAFLAETYPQIRCIDLGHNHGFAEGYNLALAQVTATYVVLLNSDIEVTPGWLHVLTDYMDKHSDVAACQPKIRSLRDREFFEHAGASGGFIDSLGYPFCRGRLLSWVEKDSGQYDTPTNVFWATGACLCLRMDDFRDVGGLDARFFAHQEEIDLCWRLRSRGRRVMCVPAATVFHLGGATLNKENPHKTFLNYRNNLLMLYKNIPGTRLYLVFLIRFFFDYLSALVFLFTGKRADANAVLKARIAFWRMRPSFRPQRVQNRSLCTQRDIPEVFKGSILFDVYFGGKRSFKDLKWR
jgi:GT2 family glycosyltransferase